MRNRVLLCGSFALLCVGACSGSDSSSEALFSGAVGADAEAADGGMGDGATTSPTSTGEGTKPPNTGDDSGVDPGTTSGGDDAGADSPPFVVPDGGGPPVTLRVYVAGESIEQFNRFTAAPFKSDGSLNDPGNNDREQYGWMVPFADRLRLRDPGITVEWVGAEGWINRDWSPSTGTYPSRTPGNTSAIGGTTIADWLSQRRDELTNRTFCYDVAFASRGGNDAANSVSEGTYKARLTELIKLLDAGSKCRTHPLVYVTSHMPDSAGWNYNTDSASIQQWNQFQKLRYVDWTSAVIASVKQSSPTILIRYADDYTPFLKNRKTTAFPNPDWLANGGANLAKIHIDEQHPMRLGSIYAGEVVADAIDLSEVRSIR